ncbi:MAG: nucleotidyltransferase domain-containing protein [Lachnospiraceae bacterium]
MGRHEKSLQYALQQLKSDDYKEYVQSIYLYGSFSRKNHKYDSDVDLFVCVRENTPAKIIAKMRSSVISDDYTLPEVELKISKSTLFSSSRQFNENLQREAQLLWENQ